MRLSTVADLLATLAPPQLAAEWDNTGWQVHLEDADLRGVLVSLDATPEVVAEAAAFGANLLVTHHPLLFRPLRRLEAASPIGTTLLAAVRAGLSIFALHTNLDAAPGGTSWALAEALGLRGETVLSPGPEPGTGFGVVGVAAPRTLAAWTETVAERLGSLPLAVSGVPAELHERVAVMGGSGAGERDAARARGATLLITADVRYHEAQQARAAGLSLIVLDHFASEWPAMQRVAAFLAERLPCPVACSRLRTSPWERLVP